MQCTNKIWLAKIALYVPCGKCLNCRIARSREWAVRILHECKSYEKNIFVTLTYEPEKLPANGQISIKECQRFIKRVRKRLGDRRIKYYMCGEYGEKNGRPHYHAIMFGLGLKDRKIIEESWRNGFAYIGTVTYDSARYVSDYVHKKYAIGNKEQGKENINKPFQLSSQGIGKIFASTNQDYLVSKLGCTVNGREVGLPRYYRKILDIQPEHYQDAQRSKKEEKYKEYRKKGYEVAIEEGVICGELQSALYAADKQRDLNVKAKIRMYSHRKL